MNLHFQDFEIEPDIAAAADGSERDAAADAPRQTFRATIKSAAFDRANNSFNISGIRIPSGGVPILWQHDRSGLPLGWVSDFTKTDKALKATLNFNEGHEYGMWFANLISSGAVRNVSGGFVGVQRKELDDPKNPKNYYMGYVHPAYYIGRTAITKAELVEVSLVNVPADRTARIAASLDGGGGAATITRADLRRAFGLN